jgi:hypothetical protein
MRFIFNLQRKKSAMLCADTVFKKWVGLFNYFLRKELLLGVVS